MSTSLLQQAGNIPLPGTLPDTAYDCISITSHVAALNRDFLVAKRMNGQMFFLLFLFGY